MSRTLIALAATAALSIAAASADARSGSHMSPAGPSHSVSMGTMGTPGKVTMPGPVGTRGNKVTAHDMTWHDHDAWRDHDHDHDRFHHHHRRDFAFFAFPFYASDYNNYDYGDYGCIQYVRVHTHTGVHWRRVWVCD